ncbi:MAG: alginate export family protein [Alphaproteobacteria bacterium]|uniref:alginate export family protein n=1 Tax=Brevundimonas sp. TaxID=1871086 RepID=UPI001D5529D9|nr:alginate export family protein [Brevundimonas sp.]MBU2349721.1 alginate export family protein [Alphaproteobacteria bacterium]MBU2398800.1 alginate export family protein [Alphaproteobacteria bacterium]MBU4196707.1 alginate export family protein [Alphaproteobacteria bacterium]MBU4237809.1 alginate export family protein [Alphaproteobacteria bacterium]MCG2663119.1 alginate export family protein [Brevundimonas sp.]
MFDSRAFGQGPLSSVGVGEVNALELVQAYAKIRLGARRERTLKLGRFTMDLGSKRFVSRQNFRNTTNAYTGARFDTPLADGALTAFWVMPQVRLPDDRAAIEDNRIAWDRESSNLQFAGLFWTRDLGQRRSLDLYVYGLTESDDADQQARNRRLATPGVRWRHSPAAGAWDVEVEAAAQVGQVRRSASPADTQDVDVRAGFIHLEAGRTFAHDWSPRLAAQFDNVTGDGGRGDYGRFDTLYGARRFEFGPAGLYGPVSRANLVSPGVRLEVKPDRKLDGFVAVRGLWLEDARDSLGATGVIDPSSDSGRFGGTQIEARVRYKLTPDVTLETGGARLFKGGALTDAPNAPATADTTYGYVDVTYAF